MDLGLSGAAVCVQGGSKGMGRAAARCFAAEGARVAVLAREQAAIDETVDDLRAAGSPDPVGYSVDLGDAGGVSEVFGEIGARWGELNALVNCAGPSAEAIGPFDRLNDGGWEAAFGSGTLSAVRCVRAALPLLRRASWGRIVNVSAHSVKRQTAMLPAYTAAKAALTSLSKNLSLSLAPEGILVNAVSPGTFLTESMQGYLRMQRPERGIDPESLEDAMRVVVEDFGHGCHLGRAGDAAEIGAVICFMGSQRNSYMTGADVNVDGGSDFC